MYAGSGDDIVGKRAPASSVGVSRYRIEEVESSDTTKIASPPGRNRHCRGLGQGLPYIAALIRNEEEGFVLDNWTPNRPAILIPDESRLGLTNLIY